MALQKLSNIYYNIINSLLTCNGENRENVLNMG